MAPERERSGQARHESVVLIDRRQPFRFQLIAERHVHGQFSVRRSNSPSPSEATPNSSAGRRVTIWIAPPFVLRPNSVPCGPRKTSTRSISTKLRCRKPAL